MPEDHKIAAVRRHWQAAWLIGGLLPATLLLCGCFQYETPDVKIRRIEGPSSSVGRRPPEPPSPSDRPVTTLLQDPEEVAAAESPPVVVAKPTLPAVALVAAERSFFNKYDALLTAITIFALAIVVGFEVISKVPTTLHTPLMSGSNAISGITVVGAIIVGGFALQSFSGFLGCIATALAMINVVGGFLVTHRMLAMFKRK